LHEALRVAIYRHWIASGYAPSVADLSAELGCGIAAIESALRELAEVHTIVLADGSPRIEMAHPFSRVPTAYRVESAGVGYWANCAWDAFGIAAILGADTRSQAPCAGCGEIVDLSVRGGAPVGTAGVVHLLVPARHFWDDIHYT
jgi:hypothetical protein